MVGPQQPHDSPDNSKATELIVFLTIVGAVLGGVLAQFAGVFAGGLIGFLLGRDIENRRRLKKIEGSLTRRTRRSAPSGPPPVAPPPPGAPTPPPARHPSPPPVAPPIPASPTRVERREVVEQNVEAPLPGQASHLRLEPSWRRDCRGVLGDVRRVCRIRRAGSSAGTHLRRGHHGGSGSSRHRLGLVSGPSSHCRPWSKECAGLAGRCG